MALLNEKRNRIPLVATLPVDGDDGGIRGQMRMKDDATDGVIEVCVVSDRDTVSTGSIDATTSGTLDFTSVITGDASEEIVINTVGGGTAGSETVDVDGYQITITGEVGASSAAQIIAAVEASEAASALVTVVDNSFTGGLAVDSVTLSGGAGTKASQTFNTDLVLTALSSGRAGNDITLEIVDDTGADLRVVVDGKAIKVTGDSAVHETSDMVIAINANSNASKLVKASGGGATALAAAAAAPLTGGASLAVWLTLTAT